MRIQWIILLRVIFFVLFGLESPFLSLEVSLRQTDRDGMKVFYCYRLRTIHVIPFSYRITRQGASHHQCWETPTFWHDYFIHQMSHSRNAFIPWCSLTLTQSLSLSLRHTLYNLCRYPPPTLPFSHRRFKVLVFYV